MNSYTRNAFGSNSISDAVPPDSAEATLRLIAQLPAPEGIEDRVLAGLRSAPRSGRILYWPEILRPSEGWMRSAAAAAIVFVVAGGGWSIYSHIQPLRPGASLAAPARTGAAGGFSSAGAMRTPQTLNGPVIAQPAQTQPSPAKPVETHQAKKVAARVGSTVGSTHYHRVHTSAAK